jgi:phosphate starvation-inducible protein PhoH
MKSRLPGSPENKYIMRINEDYIDSIEVDDISSEVEATDDNFNDKDIVRHRLVTKIVNAFKAKEEKETKNQNT